MSENEAAYTISFQPTASQAVRFWTAALIIGALLLALWLVPEPISCTPQGMATVETEVSNAP